MFVRSWSAREAERDAETEERSFARSNHGGREATEVRFADQPREWRQGRLRSCRRLSNRVDGAADERPPRKSETERRESTHSRTRDSNSESTAASWRGEPIGTRCRQAVAETGSATDDNAFQATAGI